MTRQSGRIEAAVPVFRVASVAQSMAWYQDVLAFSPDPVGPPDDPSFAILRRDGVELMLQRVAAGVGGPRSARAAGGGWDVYVRVDDVQAIYDSIGEKVPQIGPIIRRVYGCREFELTDPDGHMIVVSQCG